MAGLGRDDGVQIDAELGRSSSRVRRGCDAVAPGKRRCDRGDRRDGLDGRDGRDRWRGWRRGRFRLRRRGRGWRRCRRRAGLDDRCERGADFDQLAYGNEQFADHTRLEHLDLDIGLVGLDDGNQVAARDRVAGRDEPFEDRAFGHVGAE